MSFSERGKSRKSITGRIISREIRLLGHRKKKIFSFNCFINASPQFDLQDVDEPFANMCSIIIIFNLGPFPTSDILTTSLCTFALSFQHALYLILFGGFQTRTV